MTVTTPAGALADLATALRPLGPAAAAGWTEVDHRFQDWTHRPGLRADLRAHLAGLDGVAAAALATRSRETTTHYAWCLRDEVGDPFSVWLHEYKPAADWRPGYADSVHNHRYHFCTTILSGGYTHQRFAVELTPAGDGIAAAVLRRSTDCPEGTGGYLLAHEFHRIPTARPGTLTVLVKSRAVRPWSLSWDPDTGRSHQHVPVENRLGDLVDRL
jgi:hypothetical protein